MLDGALGTSEVCGKLVTCAEGSLVAMELLAVISILYRTNSVRPLMTILVSVVVICLLSLGLSFGQ